MKNADSSPAHGVKGGVTYFAVTDAATEELPAFVNLFQAETAGKGQS